MMPWIGTYILDADGNPMPCEDTLEWARWFGQASNRVVAFTDLGEVLGQVSTVFLGLDHNWSPMHDPLTYKPVLWETLIFGGIHDGLMRRYDSLEAARLGHEDAVRMCMEPPDADESMQFFPPNERSQ
jgi:hypothetical protein